MEDEKTKNKDAEFSAQFEGMGKAERRDKIKQAIAIMVMQMPRADSDHMCEELADFLKGRSATKVLILTAIMLRTAVKMMPEKFQDGVTEFYGSWLTEQTPGAYLKMSRHDVH